ncbi:hypothetical protein EUGRSUZ_E00702 [Eucalyptus grandis]|uniref:Uncharacterized protein n=2 Tax=Eucalyptus grandis TaxID=71139 RepID=A0ACC3KTE5_EUCGR|nr:hypothetical protein EUGRSUZ_E00702 [Eucalyptus grandis]
MAEQSGVRGRGARTPVLQIGDRTTQRRGESGRRELRVAALATDRRSGGAARGGGRRSAARPPVGIPPPRGR